MTRNLFFTPPVRPGMGAARAPLARDLMDAFAGGQVVAAAAAAACYHQYICMRRQPRWTGGGGGGEVNSRQLMALFQVMYDPRINQPLSLNPSERG